MYIERKKPNSKRVQETKQNLQEAFLDILMEKPVEQITIREITERAQLNRTSFYRYYMDVYDLYETIVDAFLERLQKQLLMVLPDLLLGESFFRQNFFTSLLMENKIIFQRIMQDPRMCNKIKARNQAYVKNLLQLSEDDAEIDLILGYFFGGQISLLSYWFQNPEKMPEEDFFALMQGLISYGPLTQLKERIPSVIFEELEQKNIEIKQKAVEETIVDELVMKK